MFEAEGRVWWESCKAMGDLFETLGLQLAHVFFHGCMIGKAHTAELIVFLIIARFLDIVPPNYSCISMVLITSISCEIDLPQKLLLMML